MLEAFLTSHGTFALRQARHGEAIVVDPTTITIVSTGNRIKLAGGLSRRVVVVHLLQPTSANFRLKNYRQWVLKNRPALLSALLAIVDEWVARGMPGPDRAFPSYPLWSHAVGGCVAIAAEWMGYGSMTDVEEWMRTLGDQRSDEQSAFSELFQAWSRDQNGNVVSIASGQVLGIIEQAGITYFQDLLAGRNPKTHAQVMGNLLTGFWKSKREVDGLHLHRQNSSCTLYVPVPVQGGGA